MLKLITIVLIFLLIFIAHNTRIIEGVFNLHYCMGEAINTWLLGIIAAILILRR